MEAYSRRYCLDASALAKKLLLHLPRFSICQLSDASVLELETERLAVQTSQLLARYRDFLLGGTIESLTRDQFQVREVDAELARVIQERFHYLGSARNGSHFGLFHNQRAGLPAAFATVSELDVAHLRESAGGCGGGILSRMYAFPWAPRNTISALLGAVSREYSGVLFTYVNPNLGFGGVSYKAANWRLAGSKSITYRYVNCNYVSARQAMLVASADIRYSQFDLAPLQIWRNDRQ